MLVNERWLNMSWLSIKTGPIPHFIGRLLGFTTGHHRLGLFWGLANLGLFLPWLSGCESPTLTQRLYQKQPCTVLGIRNGDTCP